MNIEKGKKNLSNSEIIICGIVRNCEKGLTRNVPTINKLCDLAKNHHVIIFENDSTDKTKLILQKWEETRNNIHISLNNFNLITIPNNDISVNRFFSKARIEKMAKYRNMYLKYIKEHNLKADYILIVDLDVENIYIEGILDSFGKEQKWDAIAANGYIYSPSAIFKKRYNDSYALVECGMENTPQTEEIINKNRFKWAFLKKHMPMIRVFSAFGGLTIYRYDAIKNCEYSILYNDDNRVEVRCEHFALHKEMNEKGYNNIFINPNMRIKYKPYFFEKIKNLKLKYIHQK